jgi:hypothetical protein
VQAKSNDTNSMGELVVLPGIKNGGRRYAKRAKERNCETVRLIFLKIIAHTPLSRYH